MSYIPDKVRGDEFWQRVYVCRVRVYITPTENAAFPRTILENRFVFRDYFELDYFRVALTRMLYRYRRTAFLLFPYITVLEFESGTVGRAEDAFHLRPPTDDFRYTLPQT